MYIISEPIFVQAGIEIVACQKYQWVLIGAEVTASAAAVVCRSHPSTVFNLYCFPPPHPSCLCVCVLIVERIDQIMKASNLLQLQMASSPKQKNLKWSHGGSSEGGRKLLSMCLQLSAMKTQILEDNQKTMKCLS